MDTNTILALETVGMVVFGAVVVVGIARDDYENPLAVETRFEAAGRSLTHRQPCSDEADASPRGWIITVVLVMALVAVFSYEIFFKPR